VPTQKAEDEQPLRRPVALRDFDRDVERVDDHVFPAVDLEVMAAQ
jgi:hypothetical protein